jgi:imidazolonepropionase-like amidohydrolase
LARAGMEPDEVAASATSRAALLLGLPGGYGALVPGARTDLAWFSRDPFGGTSEGDQAGVSTVLSLGWVREGRLSVGAEDCNLL